MRYLLVIVVLAIGACNLFAPFNESVLLSRDGGNDGDGDADSDADSDGVGDTDPDGDGEVDSDTNPDSDVESDAGCTPVPTGITSEMLTSALCPTLDDSDLSTLNITEESRILETELCTITGESIFGCLLATVHGLLCVIVVKGVTVGDEVSLTVRGPNMAAILAASDVVIDGTINASALDQFGGPGGATGTGDDGAGPGGGHEEIDTPAGGGGAGHLGAGGDGGCAGGAGGDVVSPSCADAILAAGSAGGGGGADGLPAGVGGGGGGGLLIYSGTSISVEGNVHADGGRGGNSTAGPINGSGGGGAGGTIQLEARQVEIWGTLSASGGNGGNSHEAPGGHGGATTDNNTVDGQLGACGSFDVGGGGGGGAGKVSIRTCDSAAYISGDVRPAALECISQSFGE